MLELAFDPATVTTVLLATSRNAAWFLLAPPYGRQIPTRVRTGLAFALALLMTGSVEAEVLPMEFLPLAWAVLYQVFIGASLGFVVYTIFAVFEAAGGILDFSAAFTASTIFDPQSGSQSGVLGRSYNVFALVLLFASGGHLLILDGYLRTFRAAPLTGPSIDALGLIFTDTIGWFFVAALEIALPVAGALLLVEISLGLIARAAPQTNVLSLGFALKSLVVLSTLTLGVSLLPMWVERVTDRALSTLF